MAILFFVIVIIVVVIIFGLLVMLLPSNSNSSQHHHRSRLEENRELLLRAGFTPVTEPFSSLALAATHFDGENESLRFLKIQPEGHSLDDEPRTHFSYDPATGHLTAHDLEQDVTGPLRHLGTSIVPDGNQPTKFELYQQDDTIVVLSTTGDFLGTGDLYEPGRFKLLRRREQREEEQPAVEVDS